MAKKTGHVAVPFLLTVFIGLIIIGGGAMFAWHYLGIGKEKEPSELVPMTNGIVTYEDSHTLLFCLDDAEDYCPPTFVLMRSNPAKKQLVFVGIPSNSIAIADDKQVAVMDDYRSGGAAQAVDFVEKVFDIEVDKYMMMNGDAFKQLCDICGGVQYPANADIAGFNNDGTPQFLNSDQTLTFLTYTMFAGGESERAFTASSVVSTMVNQADGKRLSDMLDNSFNTMINITESDITSEDYRKRKNAIKYMLENGNAIALSISLDGTVSEEDFILSSDFISSIKEEYFIDKK